MPLDDFTIHDTARIDLIDQLWRRFQSYVSVEGVRPTSTMARDLERRVVDWVMELRSRHNFFCLRLGDSPDDGLSGTKYKVDDVAVYAGRNTSLGFLIECKALRFLGRKSLVGPATIAGIVGRAIDLCPPILFARRFYRRTSRNYCMLITARPLRESAMRVALSLGVSVVQPTIEVLKRIMATGQEIESVDHVDYFPPEVLWKQLRHLPNASRYNIRVARHLCRYMARRTLETISVRSCDLGFLRKQRMNEYVFSQVGYLSAYVKKLRGDRLL